MTEKKIRQLLSKKLKFYRTQMGLSQIELAEKADLATNFISDIENCKKWVSPETLAKLSNALHIHPYNLFTEIELYNSFENNFNEQFCTELANNLISEIQNFSEKFIKKEKNKKK